MSITAFPVLARLLKEGGLIYTKPGALVMGAAAINDAIAWCLLILAISIANAGNMKIAGYVFLCVVALACGMFFILREPWRRIVAYIESFESAEMNSNLFAITIAILFVCAWTTDLIGVHWIFGAFLFGLIMPRGSHLVKECEERIEPVTLAFFLPLYFTYSGLQTDITQIHNSRQGLMILLVCFIATIGKWVGCGGTALLSGLSIRESAVIAALMNTRGLIELIVLNLGKQSKILNTQTFSVMVIMCLFTTFLTSPLVAYIYPPHLRVRASDEEAALLKGQNIDADVDGDLPNDEVALLQSKEMSVLVVVDQMGYLQWIMNLLRCFSAESADSLLTVTAVRLEEPTNTGR